MILNAIIVMTLQSQEKYMKLESERNQNQELLKESESKLTDSIKAKECLESQVKSLETQHLELEKIHKKQLQEKQDEILEFKSKWESEKKAFEATQSLATQAGFGLAKKDELIHEFKTKLDSLEKQIKNLKSERQKTIDAHQSRVKQLQENFLIQFKEAGKLEVLL